jgi:DNA-binding transcriptional LysR family regulator
MNTISDDYALFAAVVEEGSLSAAGRALKLSPAMVSKRLAALETRLGARLIQRTTRRSVLTDVGQAFHEQVVAILSAIRQAELMVAGRTGTPSGRL